MLYITVISNEHEALQITGNQTVCSMVCLDKHQRKHQCQRNWPFMREIHRWSVDSPVRQEAFLYHDVIVNKGCTSEMYLKLKSRDISFVHHLLLNMFSNRLEILHRAQHYPCRALCQVWFSDNRIGCYGLSNFQINTDILYCNNSGPHFQLLVIFFFQWSH